jgi:hypothetical protein
MFLLAKQRETKCILKERSKQTVPTREAAIGWHFSTQLNGVHGLLLQLCICAQACAGAAKHPDHVVPVE